MRKLLFMVVSLLMLVNVCDAQKRVNGTKLKFEKVSPKVGFCKKIDAWSYNKDTEQWEQHKLNSRSYHYLCHDYKYIQNFYFLQIKTLKINSTMRYALCIPFEEVYKGTFIDMMRTYNLSCSDMSSLRNIKDNEVIILDLVGVYSDNNITDNALIKRLKNANNLIYKFCVKRVIVDNVSYIRFFLPERCGYEFNKLDLYKSYFEMTQHRFNQLLIK